MSFVLVEDVTLSKVSKISKNHHFPPEQPVFRKFRKYFLKWKWLVEISWTCCMWSKVIFKFSASKPAYFLGTLTFAKTLLTCDNLLTSSDQQSGANESIEFFCQKQYMKAWFSHRNRNYVITAFSSRFRRISLHMWFQRKL